jgi:hypothetical protein
MHQRRPPVGRAYQTIHALGAAPTFAPNVPTNEAPHDQAAYNEDDDPSKHTIIPAFYTASIILGGQADARNGGSVALRPERFELRRITWATTGDVSQSFPLLLASMQGRCTEVSWGDEFVNFLGSTPTLIAGLFGDSEGFLDLPRPILFQGRQTLNVQLHRLFWPFDPNVAPPIDTRFDFTFQGVGILPKNVGISGSL